ncbi:MAG: TerB family tellurite resistance protein [Prevotella sp.]|nr:TerB family tellurite resistance protein [Prevotella sp.]
MDLSIYDKMALSQFSSLEKESLYQVVCAAMMVDGVKDPREVKLVEEIVNIIGLSPSERAASRQLDEPTMSRTIRNMSELKRAYVAKFIAQMILVDGKIAPIEEKFFYYICDSLNLPHAD